MAMPAEPVKPVSQASRSSEGATYSFCCCSAPGTDESRQFPPRQLLAERPEPRGQRHAALGLLECLEMRFEHCAHILGLHGGLGNRCEFSLFWHKLCLDFDTCSRQAGTACTPNR